MEKLKHIETVPELLHGLGIGNVRHPLIEVIDMASATKAENFDDRQMSFGFFMVVYKKNCCGNVRYGQNTYDYSDGTLLFFAPYQTIHIQDLAQHKSEGQMLLFHPELLRGTTLDCRMKRYSFFGYHMNEALHVSACELKQLLDNLDAINAQLDVTAACNSGRAFVPAISSLLNLSLHFYERQFDTRRTLCEDVVSRFERILSDFLSGNTVAKRGLPSMTYLADRLFLSPNYLGDLIKNATGRSAKDFINRHVIEEAKRRLTSSDIPVNEIAYSLGFEYPQYFSQMFKKHVGQTPKQYRESIKYKSSRGYDPLNENQ